MVYIFLWRSLDAQPAGLYFYKMYSFCVEGNDINLQMTVSPVSFKYRMALAFKKAACDVLSLPA